MNQELRKEICRLIDLYESESDSERPRIERELAKMIPASIGAVVRAGKSYRPGAYGRLEIISCVVALDE